MSQDMIALAEAAKLLGKNLRTIQRHIKAGTLTRHYRDGKNFVSRIELESKFKLIGQKPKPVADTPTIKESKTFPTPTPTKTTDDFWPKEAQEYQKKWTDEIQKHAQTKEQLGEWRGRAEAYQAFASRLLGDGKMPEIKPETKKDEIVAPEVPISSSKNNSAISPLLLYIIMTILFLALVFVIIIFVIIYRNRMGLF